MLFSRALKDNKAWKFVLQDYNDIFSLVTVPNLFLTWYVSEHGTADHEINITQELKDEFLRAIHRLGIGFQFVVGAWGASLSVQFQLTELTRNICRRTILYCHRKGFTLQPHYHSSLLYYSNARGDTLSLHRRKSILALAAESRSSWMN